MEVEVEVEGKEEDIEVEEDGGRGQGVELGWSDMVSSILASPPRGAHH